MQHESVNLWGNGNVFESIDRRVLCDADLITLSQNYPATNDNELRLDISTAEQVTDTGIQELAARMRSCGQVH